MPSFAQLLIGSRVIKWFKNTFFGLFFCCRRRFSLIKFYEKRLINFDKILHLCTYIPEVVNCDQTVLCFHRWSQYCVFHWSVTFFSWFKKLNIFLSFLRFGGSCIWFKIIRCKDSPRRPPLIQNKGSVVPFLTLHNAKQRPLIFLPTFYTLALSRSLSLFAHHLSWRVKCTTFKEDFIHITMLLYDKF